MLKELLKEYDNVEVQMLYSDVPNTLSQLVRTAFIPRNGYRFIVSDFSAIEARVLSWLAGETWRMEVFAGNGDIYCASASQMFKVPVEKHGQNAHLRQKGKIAELALGYGGSVGALKAMGALDMGLEENELKPLVDVWRQSNPNIVQLWWDVDKVVKEAVKERISTNTHGINFSYESGFLFIILPSGFKNSKMPDDSSNTIMRQQYISLRVSDFQNIPVDRLKTARGIKSKVVFVPTGRQRLRSDR